MSCINKAPVISNMMKSNSAAGLSLTAACGEVIMYSNAAFYNYLRGNPFTAYGETMMLVLQTCVIVGLIFWFRRGGPDKIGPDKMVLAVTGYFLYLFVVFRGKPTSSIHVHMLVETLMQLFTSSSLVLTPDTQYILMVYNPVVLIISRGSQVIVNYKQKQTGAQSIATTGLNLIGTLIRIGTTIKEVGWDFHILRAYGVSVTLNSMLFLQLVVYKENTETYLKSLKQKKKE